MIEGVESTVSEMMIDPTDQETQTYTTVDFT